MMMASLIFVVSMATLLMFFVSYCRSLTASSVQHELSKEVRDVAGIQKLASGRDFARVMQLLQLCPESPEDRGGLQAVGAYYKFLSFVQNSVARILPSLQTWAEQERASCANFAAVALDRRIAFNREFLSEQSEF
jgi:hypothetical protein